MWLRNAIQNLWRRQSVDAELDEEVCGYVEMVAEEKIRSGVNVRQAYREAKMELGGVEQVKEQTREVRAGHFIETLWQDLRYGARMLRKNPGFTIVAVLTLALGIGANTAIFSVVDAVLLKPLHYNNPAALALVWESLPKRHILHNVVSPANFMDWQEHNHAFSDMAVFIDQPLNLTGAGDPEQIPVEMVSPNFFSVLGVRPMLGRAFTTDEGQKGKDNVVVLGYRLWQSRFGGDRNIVGKAVQLNGEANTVVGVTGPDFDWYISEFSFTHKAPQLWTPLVIRSEWRDRTKSGRFLRVLARLKPGVSMEQAQAQMNVISAGLAARYPDYDKNWGITVVSLRGQLSDTLRPALLVLLGAVGLVLLIACANISSLLLSRAAGRKREIAIRVALGASRWRIARQLLTESVLLAVVGGTIGTLVAIWATEALVQAGSASFADVSGVAVNWRVLVFAVAATLLAGLLSGFLPSFISAHGAVASALPEGGRTSSAGRKGTAARNTFVVVEISLALVLLVGSSLLIQSFFRLTEVDPGFQTAHLLTFQIGLPHSKYATDQALGAFFADLLARIRQLPNAISASADVTPPFSGVGAATDFQIVGEAPLPVGESHGTSVRVIEPDYFHTMSIPLLRGRTFTEKEFAEPASHVVIVSSSFAQQYFPGGDAIGRKVIIDMKDKNVPSEIVGVVGDVHLSSLSSAPYPVAYWPYPELAYSVMTIVVRTPRSPLALVPEIRQMLKQIDKDQPMSDISTMDQLVANSVARSRFTMFLLAVFAGLALILAVIGIYGVMAYAVTQRTQEIGIRMALGAQPRDILRLVLGNGAKFALTGVALGLAGAFAATRLMNSLLFDVTSTDPATFGGVAVLLTIVALAACYIPARRAMRMDPMTALRYE